jgi:hypothetical protein
VATDVYERSKKKKKKPSGTADPAEVIRRLAWPPDCLDRAMIGIPKPLMLLYVKLADQPPSFGTLNRLPLEIQHTILNMLDLQTISRISRVSVHGLAVVQNTARTCSFRPA